MLSKSVKRKVTQALLGTVSQHLWKELDCSAPPRAQSQSAPSETYMLGPERTLWGVSYSLYIVQITSQSLPRPA